MPADDAGPRSIGVGSLVVVHCSSPREKHWGLLLEIDGLGVVLRGLDLASVEDWLAQERAESEPLIAPSTFFVPTHRLSRIDLDESGPVVTGYGDRFRQECGRDVRAALLGHEKRLETN
jgi:hypothetical protein